MYKIKDSRIEIQIEWIYFTLSSLLGGNGIVIITCTLNTFGLHLWKEKHYFHGIKDTPIKQVTEAENLIQG